MVGCLEALGVRHRARLGGRRGRRRRHRRAPAHRARSPSTPGSRARRRASSRRCSASASGAYRLTGHPQLPRAADGPDRSTRCEDLGVDAEAVERARPPARRRARDRAASRAARIRLPGHVSSQFLSGLLLAAPLMHRGLVVELTSELVSKPYVELTVAVMRRFGVDGRTALGGRAAALPADRRFDVEPDASAASYFFAAAAICGGRVRVRGLGRDSAQGDLRFVDVLGRMGADVERRSGLRRGAGHRRSCEGSTSTSPTCPTRRRRSRSSPRARRRRRGCTRHRVHPPARRPTASPPSSPSCGGAASTPRRRPTASSSGRRRRRRTAPRRDLRRPPHGDELRRPRPPGARHRDRRSRLRGQDLPRLLRGARHAPVGSRLDMGLRVIAIDGPAGSGKSTVARAVAERLGLEYLDTGAMYRSVAFAALRGDVDPADAEAVAALVPIARDRRRPAASSPSTASTPRIEIRGPEVTRAVSTVAANPAVRTELRDRQRAWAERARRRRDRGPRHRLGRVPRRRAQGVPDRQPRGPGRPAGEGGDRPRLRDGRRRHRPARRARPGSRADSPLADRRRRRRHRHDRPHVDDIVDEVLARVAEAEARRDRREDPRPGDDARTWLGSAEPDDAGQLRHRPRR